MVTKLRRRDSTLPRTWYALRTQRQWWAMQCHVIILDTTGTRYTFYAVEKQKQKNNGKTKKQTRQIERERKEENIRRKKLTAVVPPPRAMWRTLEKNELEKERKRKKNTTTIVLVNRVYDKEPRENNRQTKV